MKKLILIAMLVALGVVAARKVRSSYPGSAGSAAPGLASRRRAR